MPAITQLSVINRARVIAGEETVADLTPVDAMMRAALASYEDMVLEEIENAQYLFTLKRSTPTLTDTDTNRTLPFKYTIPAESLGIVGVHYNDMPLDGVAFEIEGGYVWTAFDTNVTFLYKIRPDESVWPRKFSQIIVDELTAIFMRGTERHSEAQSILANAARRRVINRNSEARQRHNRPMGEGSLVNRRRGVFSMGFVGMGGGSSGGGSGGGSGPTRSPYRFVTATTPGVTDITAADDNGTIYIDCAGGDINQLFSTGSELDGVTVMFRRKDSGPVNPNTFTVNTTALELSADGMWAILQSAGGVIQVLSRS